MLWFYFVQIGPAKEYVEMLCENQKLKFLVFAYHRAMMNGLSESLHDKHVKFIRIDGETPPSERPVGLVAEHIYWEIVDFLKIYLLNHIIY